MAGLERAELLSPLSGGALLVSRQASYIASAFAPWFVARRDTQAMASSIGKGRNAATGQGADALRERRRRSDATYDA